jgi:signal transduction histidine kinase
MVEQILEFAGANSRKRTYKFQLWPVAQIVDDAIRQCGPLLESQNVDLEIDVDADLPVINADPEALSRAIQNLVANSIKYRNGNSWMRVSASNGDGTVKITVEDRGIGISKGDLRQVFEPFFRSKEVVDAQIHGNGLGLAIVKQIAEAHCGRVMAESEPGQGSKFTIELPVEN